MLVENTRLSEQYFTAVQKFVVFDLGLTLLPVSGQTEAAQLIAQVVSNKEETERLLFPTKYEMVPPEAATVADSASNEV